MSIIAEHGQLLLLLACLFGFFMAWGVGANDVANAMGTSVGAKALTIKQAKAPGSLTVAATLGNIGVVLDEQGDLKGALKHYRQALTIQQAKAPGSLNVARTLCNIGNVFSKHGRFVEFQNCGHAEWIDAPSAFATSLSGCAL